MLAPLQRGQFDHSGDDVRGRGGWVSARVHAHIHAVKRTHKGRELGEQGRERDRQRGKTDR